MTKQNHTQYSNIDKYQLVLHTSGGFQNISHFFFFPSAHRVDNS